MKIVLCANRLSHFSIGYTTLFLALTIPSNFSCGDGWMVRGWSFLMLGTRSEERLWVCEMFFDHFMGVWNVFWNIYGGAKTFWCGSWGYENIMPFLNISFVFYRLFYGGMKFIATILWGHEILFMTFMGARNYFEAFYGGLKILRLFWKVLPTGYPAVKKTRP